MEELGLNVEDSITKIGLAESVAEDPVAPWCRNACWYRNSVYLNGRQEKYEEAGTTECTEG